MKKTVQVLAVLGIGMLLGVGCDVASNIANDNDNSNNKIDNSTKISVTNGNGTVDIYGTNTNGVYGLLETIPAGGSKGTN